MPNFSIFADTVNYDVKVTVTKSLVPMKGATVLVDGKVTSGYDPDTAPITGINHTNSNGLIVFSVPAGNHEFSVGNLTDCKVSKKENIRSKTSITLSMVCTTDPVTPTPTPTPEKEVSPEVTLTPQPATGKGALTFQITDAKTKKNLSGAEIVLTSSYKSTSGKTSSSGYYRFSDLPSREEGTIYDAQLLKSGYVSQNKEYTVRNGQTLDYSIELLPEGYIPAATPTPAKEFLLNVSIKDKDFGEDLLGINYIIEKGKRDSVGRTIWEVARNARLGVNEAVVLGPEDFYGYRIKFKYDFEELGLYNVETLNFEIPYSEYSKGGLISRSFQLKRNNKAIPVVILADMKSDKSNSFVGGLKSKVSVLGAELSGESKDTAISNHPTKGYSFSSKGLGLDGPNLLIQSSTLANFNFTGSLKLNIESDLFFYDNNNDNAFDDGDNSLAKTVDLQVIDSELIVNLGKINLKEKKLSVLTIKDYKTKKPIADATVEIAENGCGFKINKKSDINGKIYFDEIDTNKISSLSDSTSDMSFTCIKSAVYIKIAGDIKKYSSRISDLSEFYFFDKIAKDESFDSEIFLYNKSSTKSTNIIGVIKDADTKSAIPDTKVSLYSESAPTGMYATTNVSGSYNMSSARTSISASSSLSAGTYMLIPFKVNYLNINSNYIPIKISEGEEVFIVQFLKPGHSDEDTKLDFYVFDQNTLELINDCRDFAVEEVGAGSEIKMENNNVFTIKAQPDIKEVEFTVSAYCGSVQIRENKKVNITDTRSGDRLSYVHTKLYRESDTDDLMDLKKNPDFLTILVEDNTGSPIKGADIYINKDSGTKVNYPFYLYSKTKSDGKAVLTKDFTKQNDRAWSLGLGNLYDILEVNPYDAEYFTDEFYIFVEKDGYRKNSRIYDFKSSEEGDTLLIKMQKKDDIDLDEGSYCDITYTGSAKNSAKKIELLAGNNINSDLKPIEIVADDIYENTFVVNKDKYYQFRVENDDGTVIYSKVSPKTVAGESYELDDIDCYGLSSINYGDGIYFVFTDNTKDRFNRSFYDNLHNKLKSTMGKTRAINPLVVDFSELRAVNAYALFGAQPDLCLSPTKTIPSAHYINIHKGLVDWSESLESENILFFILIHEYGHIIDGEYSLRLPSLFSGITDDSSLSKCVWNDIKEGMSFATYGSFGGHPWDDPEELFASFYSNYYSNHERLYGMIMYHATENSACQNVLKYMWRYYTEKVGKYYDNDDKLFVPVGGSLGSTEYTFDQIKNGDWLQSNYEKRTFSEKAKIQYTRIVSPIIKTLTPGALSEAVTKFNNWVKSQLAATGIYGKVGRVTGKVKTNRGLVVTNAVVKIGDQLASTDRTGTYTIVNIPIGSKLLESVDTGSKRTIVSPTNNKITVLKDKTTKLNITIK